MARFTENRGNVLMKVANLTETKKYIRKGQGRTGDFGKEEII